MAVTPLWLIVCTAKPYTPTMPGSTSIALLVGTIPYRCFILCRGSSRHSMGKMLGRDLQVCARLGLWLAHLSIQDFPNGIHGCPLAHTLDICAAHARGCGRHLGQIHVISQGLVTGMHCKDFLASGQIWGREFEYLVEATGTQQCWLKISGRSVAAITTTSLSASMPSSSVNN